MDSDGESVLFGEVFEWKDFNALFAYDILKFIINNCSHLYVHTCIVCVWLYVFAASFANMCSFAVLLI